MGLSESEFMERADDTLEKLMVSLEEQDGHGLLDLEEDVGMLSITLESGKVFVVSRNTAAREMWLSSPVSGGLHFRATGDGWQLPDGRSLVTLLTKELSELTGQQFHG